MSRRIAVFSHKGGTGKTVSCYHIGWKLTALGYKVLLVDGDSQVNLTALTLGFDRFDTYYETEDTRSHNIKDAVAPVFEGKPAALEPFDCPTAKHNSNLFLLPGHADLSGYEGQVSLAQETMGSLSVMKNLPGAINALIGKIEEHHNIDYTIIDLNPGLGAINQNLLMASDAFIVPTNPDPFSLIAVSTLANHLIRWNQWKTANISKFSDSNYPLRDSVPVFLGTLNSRFNKHASKAVKNFDERIKEIDRRVEAVFFPNLQEAGMTLKEECYDNARNDWKETLTDDNDGKYVLARIPDFQGLIHVSYDANLPIFKLDDNMLKKAERTGAVGNASRDNVKTLNKIYEAIASKIVFLTHGEF